MAADLVLLIKNTEELVSSDQSQLKKKQEKMYHLWIEVTVTFVKL